MELCSLERNGMKNNEEWWKVEWNCLPNASGFFLLFQAKWERANPAKSNLDILFNGKELVTCCEAYNDFQTLVDKMGGSGEKRRTQELMRRVQVVDDSPSQRVLNLKLSSNVKPRSRIIFGTADQLRMIIVTANTGFIRSAEGQVLMLSLFFFFPNCTFILAILLWFGENLSELFEVIFRDSSGFSKAPNWNFETNQRQQKKKKISLMVFKANLEDCVIPFSGIHRYFQRLFEQVFEESLFSAAVWIFEKRFFAEIKEDFTEHIQQ